MTHYEHTPTHQRLDAYRVAVDLFRGVEDVAARFPRGYGDMKDQLGARPARSYATSPRV